MRRHKGQDIGHDTGHDTGQDTGQGAGELPVDGRRHFALMQQAVRLSKENPGHEEYREVSADIRAELTANQELLKECSAPEVEEIVREFASAVMGYLSSTEPLTASPALIFSPIDLNEECRLVLRADECRAIARTSADPDVDRALGGLYDAVAVLGRATRRSPEPGILIVNDLEAPTHRASL